MMAKFRIQYSAGFGHFTQNHKGFGPTIYIEEVVEFDNGKDYFDYIEATKYMPIMRAPIDAMKRGLIEEVFPVGVKTIDALLTCGVG
ncbi:hypothetical protein VWO18_07870, partial [Campylobacter coli]